MSLKCFFSFAKIKKKNMTKISDLHSNNVKKLIRRLLINYKKDQTFYSKIKCFGLGINKARFFKLHWNLWWYWTMVCFIAYKKRYQLYSLHLDQVRKWGWHLHNRQILFNILAAGYLLSDKKRYFTFMDNFRNLKSQFIRIT